MQKNTGKLSRQWTRERSAVEFLDTAASLASSKPGGEATTPLEAENIARGSDTTFNHEPVPPWKFPKEGPSDSHNGRAKA